MKSKFILSILLFGFVLLAGCVSEQPTTMPQPAMNDTMPGPVMNDTMDDHDTMPPAMNDTNTSMPAMNDSNITDIVVNDTETAPPTPQTREFDMSAKQWEFIPDTITVNKGDTVILHITSIDVKHGIALNQFGVSENLEPGKTVDVTFVADKEGSYTFFCNVFCGSGHSGMRGTLIVE
jgi:cytochrome c oxidase subunit 2